MWAKTKVIICYIVTLVFSKRLKAIFSIFTMSEFVEQRSAIKFCLRDEISAAETYKMLQKAFGDLSMSQKNVYKWYKDFKESRERVDDLERPGRPSTSTDKQHVNQIKELVHKNHWHFKKITQHRFKRYFGQTTRDFCITIMHRLTLDSFFMTISPKTQRISFHNNHIRLIWLRVTSVYSPNSKDHSENTVLTRLKRYKPNRRRL